MASFKSWASIFGENKWRKALLIVGGCAIVGFSAFAVYYYYYSKNKNQMVDEGFEDISVADESEKRILVLGLDGSGKTSFLSNLSKQGNLKKEYEPNDGFSVVSVNVEKGKTVNFWEVGGLEKVRVYWSNFLMDTDVLVYVVDSTDDHRLPESILELQKLAASEKLKKVPIVILANKQDLPNALPSEDIAEAFGTEELSLHHKIQVLPLQVPFKEPQEAHESVKVAKNLIISLCSAN